MAYVNAAMAVYGVYQGMQQQKAGAQATKAADPFSKWRGGYGSQLYDLMHNPGNILNDPTFVSSMKYGMQGVNRSMAAQGYNISGNQMMALEDYGQSHATAFMTDRQKFLADLAGAGRSADNGAGFGQSNTGTNNVMAGMGTLGSYLATSGGGGGTGTTGASWGGGQSSFDTFGANMGNGVGRPFGP